MSQGRPVSLIVPNGKNSFKFNEEALKKILLNDDIKDHFVVCVSIAGVFRGGKSFMLNFFIRFLEAQYVRNDTTDWIKGGKNECLEGFSWSNDSAANTSGILMWSEVFLTQLKTGEKVAILVFDTQGIWDNKTTLGETTTIFALSTLLSSLQIFNLKDNILETDLNHLQLFAEFGRLASTNSGETIFQELLFLIRDWKYSFEDPFGYEGGTRRVQNYLTVPETGHSDIRNIRQNILSCFSKISGFLMPKPGDAVSNNFKFKGDIEEISPEFKQSLNELIPRILGPEFLRIKEIYGRRVTCAEFVQYVKLYAETLTADMFPKPESLLTATIKVYNQKAVADATKLYKDSMKEWWELLTDNDDKPMTSNSVENVHIQSYEKAMKDFKKKSKLGGQETRYEYMQQLEANVDEIKNHYRIEHAKKMGQVACTTAATVYKNSMDEFKNATTIQELFIDEVFKTMHHKSAQKAFDLYQQRMSNSDPDLRYLYHHQLLTEIRKMRKQYMSENTIATQQYLSEMGLLAVAEAINIYSVLMNDALNNQDDPFKADYFGQSHEQSEKNALKHFDEKLAFARKYYSIYLSQLLTQIEKLQSQFRGENTIRCEKYLNEKCARFTDEALNMYRLRMESIKDAVSVNEQKLFEKSFDEALIEYKDNAVEWFEEKMQFAGTQTSKFKSEFLLQIEKLCAHYSNEINVLRENRLKEKGQSAVEAAINVYKSKMNDVKETLMACEENAFKNKLEETHEQNKNYALVHYQEQMRFGELESDVIFKMLLATEIEKLYNQYLSQYANLRELNLVENAAQAVKDATIIYRELMVFALRRSGYQHFNYVAFETTHQESQEEALTYYGKQTNFSETEVNISYRYQLLKEIKQLYNQYLEDNRILLRKEIRERGTLTVTEMSSLYREKINCGLEKIYKCLKLLFEYGSFDHQHKSSKDAAVAGFDTKMDFCQSKFSISYKQELLMNIERMYSQYLRGFANTRQNLLEECGQLAVTESVNLYSELMDQENSEFAKNKEKLFKHGEFDKVHRQSKVQAETSFHYKMECVPEQFTMIYKNQLLDKIEEKRWQYVEDNNILREKQLKVFGDYALITARIFYRESVAEARSNFINKLKNAIGIANFMAIFEKCRDDAIYKLTEEMKFAENEGNTYRVQLLEAIQKINDDYEKDRDHYSQYF